MSAGNAVRILMYSHDTYGLGHLTRTTRIARALRSQSARASILILSGSPMAQYFPLPAGADLVKMPSVVKSGPDRYRSRDLDISFSRIRKMRRDLIRGTAEAFRPHFFLVDNVPLGMKGEVLPTLDWLRNHSPATRIILNLRDILDDPTVIREDWHRTGVPAVLDRYYDQIFVLGDETLFDAVEAYGLPAAKTCHVGYGAPNPRQDCDETSRSTGRRLLVAAGGGGDGAEFIRSVLRGIERLRQSNGRGSRFVIDLHVVMGPLMDAEDRRDIGARAISLGAEVHDFVRDLPDRMRAADLVVAMAGYNTCCEILANARAALVFPRTHPRLEQHIRAATLARSGILSMFDSKVAEPDDVAHAIANSLETGPRIAGAALPALDGLKRLAEKLGHELVLPRGASPSMNMSPEGSAMRIDRQFRRNKTSAIGRNAGAARSQPGSPPKESRS